MTAYASSRPRAASFIVYINGIEVPAKSVSLRYGVWQIPEMQVDMVADPVLTRIGAEDRIQVAVFYLDDVEVDPSVMPQFRLFGEGEITGWGYRNTSAGRVISFTVVNQIAIFTQLFVNFMTSIDNSLGPLTGPDGVTTVNNATDQLVYPYALFVQGLLTTQGAPPSLITRPFDYIYNIVKGMIGAQVPEAFRSIPAANFFTRWSRLNNFHNRFAASPFFDEIADNKSIFPVLRAVQDVSAVEVIVKNLLGNIQETGSFWDMLQTVYASMLMEVTMLPSMPLVSVDLISGLILPTDFKEHKLVAADGKWVSAIRDDGRKTAPKRIPNYFAKPQMLFSVPPSCNAIFPSQLKTLAYQEAYATQPTRMYFIDGVVTKTVKGGSAGLQQTIHNALSTGYPYEADLGNRAQEQHANLNGKNFLLYPEEYFKGPVMDRRDIPPWLFFLANAEFKTKGDTTTKTADGAVAPATAPAQTANVPGPTAPPPPSGTALRTNANVGRTTPDGHRVFSPAVEALRKYADKAQANTGLPADFLLAWVSHESGGNIRSITRFNERGYFQIMGPHMDKGVAVPLQQTEAARLGLTLADTGTDPNDNTARLSRDPDFSFEAGVRLVLYCKKQAEKAAGQFKLSWTQGDMCRLTKLYHNASAAVFGGQTVKSFPGRAAQALGRPPVSWEEMHQTISPGLTSFEANLLQNATGVGGVVASASGAMTTRNDTRPVAAPAPQPAPAAGDASTTRQDAPTAPAAPAVSAAQYADIQRNNLTVYQLYAKYEYFRERYAKRSGSAQIAWNPYVVPGFPATIFDQRATRCDIVCYVTTVQQSMSHSGERSTTLSFLYGRQLQEMLDLMRQEFDDGETAAGAAPAEPVRDVRKIVQSFEQAEAYYQKLFYGAQALYNKDAAFDFRKVVGYAPLTDGGATELIFIDGPDEATQDTLVEASGTVEKLTKEREPLAEQLREAQGRLNTAILVREDLEQKEFARTQASASNPLQLQNSELTTANTEIAQLTQLVGSIKSKLESIDVRLDRAMSTVEGSQNTSGVSSVRHNLVGDRELVPLPAARALFESYDAAMKYNWRPICTLDEYVIFHNSAGEGQVPAFSHPQSVGARYFDRIRRFTAPPEGFQPPGLSNSILALDTPGVDGLNTTNFPQTRSAWDDALLAYRRNVLTVKAPRT